MCIQAIFGSVTFCVGIRFLSLILYLIIYYKEPRVTPNVMELRNCWVLTPVNLLFLTARCRTVAVRHLRHLGETVKHRTIHLFVNEAFMH